MKDKFVTLYLMVSFTLLLGFIYYVLPINNSPEPSTIQTNICKEDSLLNVIGQLKSEREMDEDGWDKKERRYEKIIFEYEYGLDHLKHYHPEAYKEFHRIVGYKEEFSHETERENKKRMASNF